ncbi:LOW QUALITY PROTEIN: hypothetical protein HID58_093364 [Brassica napus]|uniref:Adenylyl-sulfate kinase n=1 Tax=Brassica napus TaxID=3708 RepID=A0ABQ7XDP7_BRANA|nr:LOW QUALITY PROTEIN: hypothetical protein HID58_093364 [Brassica napus]
MEGLAIRASRPSIFCSLPGLGGDSQRRPLSDGFLRLPASSNAAVNTNLVASSVSFHPISAVNLSAQASLTADVPALSDNFFNKRVVSSGSLVSAVQGKALSRKLTYTLDGDNVRHGLNRDLTFKAEDRTENIRRIGEVAKLFADVGVICIASLISPYRRDRDACRSLLPEGDFVEVQCLNLFTWTFLCLCASQEIQIKGLYKLARAGKIKGFTGIDDPYEAPLNCEVVLKHTGDDVSCSPRQMAENIISYLQDKGYLEG